MKARATIMVRVAEITILAPAMDLLAAIVSMAITVLTDSMATMVLMDLMEMEVIMVAMVAMVTIITMEIAVATIMVVTTDLTSQNLEK